MSGPGDLPAADRRWPPAARQTVSYLSRMVLAPLLVVGRCLMLAPGACSVPTAELPRAGTCNPFTLTGVTPAPDARGVSPSTVMAATFSDFPDPETVNGSNIALFTGGFYHTGRYWVDLVERRALFKPSSGMKLGLGYTLVVKPGIRSLRGCALQPPPLDSDGKQAAEYDSRFQVVAATTDQLPTPLPLPATTYAQVAAVFGAHCAGGGCHLAPAIQYDTPLPPGDRCLAAPAGGLSLCEAEAHRALVGVPARQVVPWVLVATRDSARSYLLRKIIGAPPVVGHAGVPNDSLSTNDQHLLEDWIDVGAPGPPTPTAPTDDASAAQAADGGI